MSRDCDRRRPPGDVHPPSFRPAGFRSVIELSRDEAFELCGRLVLAHSCLVRAGDGLAAYEVASVLALIGRRVAI